MREVRRPSFQHSEIRKPPHDFPGVLCRHSQVPGLFIRREKAHVRSHLHHNEGARHHQQQQKRAIQCGYFNLLRYDPRLEDEGKNPLQIDSKEPDFTGFKDFLLSENRFAQLAKVNPEHAEELMAKCEADAKRRRERLDKMI